MMNIENAEDFDSSNSKGPGDSTHRKSEHQKEEQENCEKMHGENSDDDSNSKSSDLLRDEPNELESKKMDKTGIERVNATRRIDAVRDASLKLNSLYVELREMSGISSALLFRGRRQRRAAIIKEIEDIQDRCIDVQKQIVIQALENKRIDDATTVMRDRLTLLTEGLTKLARDKIQALVKWVKSCEEDEDMIQEAGVKNPNDLKKLMQAQYETKTQLFEFIASIGVKFTNDLEESRNVTDDLLKKARMLPKN